MSIRTIVVGVDGSEGSDRAVAWAAGLASQVGARVVAVHTFEPLAHLTDGPVDFARIEAEVRETLDHEWVAPLVSARVEYEALVRHGVPAEVLVDTAEQTDADLLVIGARGLGTLAGLALGSTSTKVVHVSDRPVVVVPPARRT